MVPERYDGAAFTRLVGEGAVEQPGITDHQIAGAHGHSLILRHRLIGRMVRVGRPPQLIGMCCGHGIVHVMALAMGTGDDAQTAVLDARIYQIVHEKELEREIGIADRIVPSPPVLMPEERRRVAGLADDKTGRPAWIRIAQRGQRIQSR